MRKMLEFVMTAMVIVVAAAIVQGAPLEKATSPIPAQPTLSTLRQQIASLMRERDAALQEFNARYSNSALADRPALEAEGAQLVENYERQYLELVVQFHRLGGNANELAQAERMLAGMNSPAPTRTPLNLDRNLTPGSPATTPSSEGGVSHDR